MIVNKENISNPIHGTNVRPERLILVGNKEIDDTINQKTDKHNQEILQNLIILHISLPSVQLLHSSMNQN